MKKKTVALVLAGTVVVAALGAGIYFGTKNTEEEVVAETENPIALDGDTAPSSNIVLDDTAEEIENIQAEMAAQENTEKANGTGEYAPIENSYDLAYEQQVAEENGTAMPTETITMYALKNSNIRETPSTDAPILGQFAKGDEVEVSVIEDDWATVVLDDGTGYVRADLLSDVNPAESVPAVSTETTGEGASSAGNTGDNAASTGSTANVGGAESTSGTAGNNGDSATSAGTENAGGSATSTGVTANDGETASNTESADPTIGKTETTEATTTAKNIDEIAASLGWETVGEFTPSSGVDHVDSNAAENSGVDISGVTLH